MNIHEIVANQKTYFKTHETKQVKFRRKKLKALKKAIQQHETDILDALNSDLGKSKVEAYATEIGIVLKSLSLFIKELKGWARKESIHTPMLQFPGKSYLYREPYGTVLIIGPYNYPFQLVIEPLIGAIAAGNTAIVKPSELTPQTSMVIGQIIESVFDTEYVQVIQGEQETTEALLNERFDFIFFTGSTRVGQIVYEKASKHLTPVALELGGKSPTIIDKTANLKVAAERIAFGKFMNAGQTCVAPDYVLIDESIKDKFISAMQSTITDFYTKTPETSPDFGRIVNDKHFNRLISLLNDAEKNIVIGGQHDASELYIAPTLLKDVKSTQKIMHEEIFGPLLPIISYQDRSEIFGFIDQYEKPLALYVFSEDRDFTDQIMREISFGGGCINDTIMHLTNPNLPFGGVGHSGIGSYHGKHSYLLFSHEKSIMTKSTKLESGMMFPPYKGKFRYVKQIFK